MNESPGFRPSTRGTASLRRRAPTLEAQPLVLIVCEGHRTEPLYFNAMRRFLRLSATRIDIVPGSVSGSDPRSIVRYARQRKKWLKRRGRRFDQIWCVFDRDEHPKIEDAFRWAAESHFALAFSNPCFELWFLLHLTDVDSPLDAHEALRRLRRAMPQYRKTASVFHLLLPQQAQALARAGALRRRLIERGRPEHENPSTSVDQLVSVLTEMGTRYRRLRRSWRREDRRRRNRARDSAENS
jgi:hypothetical protein